MAHTEPSSLACQCQNLPDSFRVSFFPKVTAFQAKGLIKSGLNSHQVMPLFKTQQLGTDKLSPAHTESRNCQNFAELDLFDIPRSSQTALYPHSSVSYQQLKENGKTLAPYNRQRNHQKDDQKGACLIEVFYTGSRNMTERGKELKCVLIVQRALLTAYHCPAPPQPVLKDPLPCPKS